MRRFVILAILLIPGCALSAQDPSVRVWFDTASVTLGDQVWFNVETIHGNDISPLYPLSITDTLVSGIEILSFEPGDTVSGRSGLTRQLQRYLVTSFDTGFYEIPPFYAGITTEGGEKRFYSDYAYLEVIRPVIAPADSTMAFFDIVPPRKAPLTFVEVIPWIGLLTLAAAGIWIVVRYFPRRSKAEEEDDSHLPAEPLHIIALRDLDKLERRKLWQESLHKEYYSELTAILRKYLDSRYRINSLEMTTPETLAALRRTGFSDEGLYALLQSIFTTADLSKFARFRPEPGVNQESIENARFFIRGTVPAENTGSESGSSDAQAGKEVSNG